MDQRNVGASIDRVVNPTGIISSARSRKELVQCPQCGSTSRVGRDFCLNCLLYQGLGSETLDGGTLEAALDAVDVRDGDWQLGNYQILEEIGRGGMGVIYRARQRHSNRIVALKRILGYHADSKETLARFRREAEAAASLDHPNILPIYEVGEGEDGLPYFSMKFAGGGSLLESMPELKRDPRRAVALMAKVSRAVQYAHQQGILHRDLKPGNVLLDGRGEPLVSDFGLARWLDTASDLTRTLTIFGTPGYIAPEQAHGLASNLKPTADIYSLGAILFDLLTGRPPFLGEHALAVIKQASEKAAPKLRSLVPKADRDLETICAKCLEREPALRYRSAHDLATDLERYLEGRPIIARPVSTPVQFWRWSRRNPKLAGSIGACVILAALGMIAVGTSTRLSTIVRRAEIARHSVALTPFEDLDRLSRDSTAAHEAMAAFSSSFGRTKDIQLKALSSEAADEQDPWNSEQWKAIGKSAGARLVVSGSVRQRGDKRRYTVHVVDTASGGMISTWMADVDASTGISTASAQRVATYLNDQTPSALAGAIVINGDPTAQGLTNNADARSYYEDGRQLLFRFNLADQEKAIKAFREAITRDPNYGQAQAMLATACHLRSITDPVPHWREEARQALAVAQRVAPNLPETHVAEAGLLWSDGRLDAAIDSYLTAYELDPGNGRAAARLANLYDQQGRPDLAIPWFEHANHREKRPLYAAYIGAAWLDLDEYDKANEAYRTASVFQPDLPGGLLGLSQVACYRGNFEEARAKCREALANYKNDQQPLRMLAFIEFFSRNFSEAQRLYAQLVQSDRLGGADFTEAVRFLSALGYVERLSSKDKSEGERLLQEAIALDEKDIISEPNNPNRLYSLAADLAGLGRVEEAIATLRKAVEAGWNDHHSLALDPRLDSIRQTQTFKDILVSLTQKVEQMKRQQPGR